MRRGTTRGPKSRPHKGVARLGDIYPQEINGFACDHVLCGCLIDWSHVKVLSHHCKMKCNIV